MKWYYIPLSILSTMSLIEWYLWHKTPSTYRMSSGWFVIPFIGGICSYCSYRWAIYRGKYRV